MKITTTLLVLFIFAQTLFSQDLSSVNFNNLSVSKLIEISSKILKKNIISTEQIDGKVDFVSQAPISKEQLLEVLETVLKAKGYRLKEENKLLKIVKDNAKEIINEKEYSFIEIINLKNAEVKNVVPIIQAIFDHKYSKKEKKPLITQDKESNSVIVYALKEDMNQIIKLVQKLDKHQMQVYVEAKIIEVSENKTKELGIKYGLSSVNASSSNIFTLGANFDGAVNALDSSTNALFTIPTQTLSSAIALGATLNLLKSNQAINIISEPSVLCVNNKESSIYVGETKSFQTALNITDGGNTNTTFQREDIGLTLKVKPRISTQNRVILEIETILEDARELQANQTNPDTTKKEIKTTAIVTNGESVILGGLIKSKNDNLNTKIPILSSIPILGELFKYKKNVQDKVNLVVIVTPYIIPKSKDLTFIREQLSELNHLEEEYTVELEKSLNTNKQKSENKQLDKQKTQEKKLSVYEQHNIILNGL